MAAILMIAIFFIICLFSEKTDYQRMREAEKLPPFTKKEAETYYYKELKNK